MRIKINVYQSINQSKGVYERFHGNQRVHGKGRALGTVKIISSNLLCKDGNARFTEVLFHIVF